MTKCNVTAVGPGFSPYLRNCASNPTTRDPHRRDTPLRLCVSARNPNNPPLQRNAPAMPVAPRVSAGTPNTPNRQTAKAPCVSAGLTNQTKAPCVGTGSAKNGGRPQ
jgi:hypothetical protein